MGTYQYGMCNGYLHLIIQLYGSFNDLYFADRDFRGFLRGLRSADSSGTILFGFSSFALYPFVFVNKILHDSFVLVMAKMPW